MMKINEIKYSATNTYLITGERGRILWDTGWAGLFPDFCRTMGSLGVPVQSIDHVLISHFHPDHMGIAQEIAECGPVIAAADVQKDYIHAADAVLRRDKAQLFHPIHDEKVKIVPISESREFLQKLGIMGEIIYTPGHSEDSISLWLDEGIVFVGDLNPLYELELHKDTRIGKSWEQLLVRSPKTVYYGHAAKAEPGCRIIQKHPDSDDDVYELVSFIIKSIDKGLSLEKIRKKTGADADFIEDAARMYLTHQNIGVQGILDRIEIRNF